MCTHAHAPHAHASREVMPHPLDAVTGEEIDAARAILVEAGLLDDDIRVPMLLPAEPTRTSSLHSTRAVRSTGASTSP